MVEGIERSRGDSSPDSILFDDIIDGGGIEQVEDDINRLAVRIFWNEIGHVMDIETCLVPFLSVSLDKQ